MDTDENYIKIQFRFFSDVLGEQTTETMWAEIIDEKAGIYQLNSIPFYAPNLASGDLISAKYENEVLVYQEAVSYSGNSTVQVMVNEQKAKTEDVMKIFQVLGCFTEGFKGGYFVFEVSADSDYSPVRAKLTELTGAGIIDYAEPCLSADHGNAV